MPDIFSLISAAWKQAWYVVPRSNQPSGCRQRLAGWADIGALFFLILLSVSIVFPAVNNLWEVALVLGPLCWAARMALDGKWDLVRTPLDLPLALMLAAGVISLATSLDPAYTFRELRIELFKWVLLYYFVVNNLRTASRGWVLLVSLAVSALIMDAYTIVDFFLQGGSLSVVKFRAAGLDKGIPNLATYLTQTAPLFMLGFLYFKQNWLKFACGLLSVMHILALYMTFSRACLGAVIVETVLIVYLLGKSWKIIAVWMIIAGLALVFLFPHRTVIPDTESPASGTEDRGIESPGNSVEISGLGVRFLMWRQAWGHIRQHPFAGIGFGRKMFLRMDQPGLKSDGGKFGHCHNTCISMALQMGVQGLAAFLLMLFMIFKTLWIRRGELSLWLETGSPGLIIGGTLLMASGYFLRNMTSQMFADNAALMFWLLVGAAFSMKIYNPGLPGQVSEGEDGSNRP